MLIVGNRIPRKYFVSSGVGESDVTIHAGSYHLALKDAGIESYNIMTYSSILPGIAEEIPKPESYTHGSVAESIMAVANPTQNELHSAGIIYGWLYDKKSQNKYGGLVCEYSGESDELTAAETLEKSIKDLYEKTYADRFELKDISMKVKSLKPQKKFGTIIVALCFVDYVYPVIK